MKRFIKNIIFKLTDRILFLHQNFRGKQILSQLKSHGEDVFIHQPTYLSGLSNITIGNHVVINAFVHIWGEGGVSIGDNCMIASHCAITSLTHSKESQLFNQVNLALPVSIGNNVWIGTHAIILPGVTIGDNVVIGAGALVNKDIPSNGVYAGTPAKKLSTLDQFS